MADKRARRPKEVTPINIGGEEMFLSYNLYALKKLKEVGIELSDFASGKEIGFSELLSVLWAGLLTYDNTLTIDEVGMLVDFNEVQTISEKIVEAINRTTTEKK